MVSFYYFLAFVIVNIVFFRIGIYFSKTKVTLTQINISQNSFKINFEIKLYIFYKFKILRIIGDEKGLKIGFIYVTYNKILRKMNVEEFAKKNFKSMSFTKIKNLKLVLEKAHIDCSIGTEDLFITVSVVTIVSVLFSILVERELIKKECDQRLIVRRKRKEFKREKIKVELKRYKYKIIPVFGKNILYLKGDLSISFKTRRVGIFLNPKEHTKFKILVGG